MQVPEGFLELESPGGEIRAVTPEDARLWVREHDDADQGSLEFWTKALEHDLVQRRGYKLVEAFAVADAAGRPGKAWRFQVRVDGEAMGYLVAMFVIEGWQSNTIRTCEYLAREATFAAQLEAVRAAIATLKG
jgi:hypothetical protein